MRTQAGTIVDVDDKAAYFTFELRSAVSGIRYEFQIRDDAPHYNWKRTIKAANGDGRTVILVHYTVCENVRWVDDVVK